MDTGILINQLAQHVGEFVTLRGWVYGKRSSGKLIFLLVRDGTGLCQCIVAADQSAAFEQAGACTQETSLRVRGTVREDARAPGGYEVLVTDVTPIQLTADYPITRKAHGVDFLMNHRHLWMRAPRQTAILRIRHGLIKALRGFFDDHGFTCVDTPILSPGAAEGAGTLFPVTFFDEDVYLAQTGQLYLESAAMALGKVYCFGPTFRAEKSKTRRHLAEFWMIEPEIAFAELPDLAWWSEALIRHAVNYVLTHHADDLATIGRDTEPLKRIGAPFPRITYTDAVDLLHSEDLHARLHTTLEADRQRCAALQEELQEADHERATATKKWKIEKWERQAAALREQLRDLETDLQHRPQHMEEARKFSWGNDLGGDEETIISQHFDQPVIITEYPRDVKAFYMKPHPDRPEVVLNLDVIAPEGYGEIVGGSQREDNYEALRSRMETDGMDPAPYEWYLDLRQYGTVPHGGFGLGLERTIAWICGLRHIRETIAFPRMMGRMTP